MTPVDRDRAVHVDTNEEFDAWLREHGTTEREVLISIYKQSSGRQGVTLTELQETAICHGWIDNLGARIDDERWALRFVPRRPGSNWSERNRSAARRLLDEGRMTAAGRALLPDDL